MKSNNLLKRNLWLHWSTTTNWQLLKNWVQAERNFVSPILKTIHVTYTHTLKFLPGKEFECMWDFKGVRKITFIFFLLLDPTACWIQHVNLRSSIGNILAFPAAIISDLATRILTPVGKQAVGENELLIENKFWLKQRERRNWRHLQKACIWAKGILKGPKGSK